MNLYHYKLEPMADNSTKYGDCEICKKPCSEVFHQVERRSYISSVGLEPGDVTRSYTHEGCHNLFGHKICLEGLRRNE